MQKKDNFVKELLGKIGFILFALAVYRLGSYIPVPGINVEQLKHVFNQQVYGMLGIFSMFSGGALSRYSIFSLGLSPYISFSIVMQVLTTISSKLDRLQKEGEMGKKQFNQYTKMGTLVVAILNAFMLSRSMVKNDVVLMPNVQFYILTTLILVSGTMFLVWLSSAISEKGLGNGVSTLIFASIVSGFIPESMHFIEQTRQGEMGMLFFLFSVAMICFFACFIVFVERAQCYINVHYPGGQQRYKGYLGQSGSFLPFKINMVGAVPAIAASTFMMFFMSFIKWVAGLYKEIHWLQFFENSLMPGNLAFTVITSFFIVGFCYLYTMTVFDTNKIADNLKKSNAFIPGIRPGDKSSLYLQEKLNKLLFMSCLYILIVMLLPDIITQRFQFAVAMKGMSFLIVVVVVIDFILQIQSFFISKKYDSLLKKSKIFLKDNV